MKIEKPPFDYKSHTFRMQVLLGCHHEECVVRRQRTVRGYDAYFWQCPKCGKKKSNQLKKSDALAYEKLHGSLESVDLEAHNNYIKIFLHYSSILTREQNLSRDAVWWKNYDGYLRSEEWQAKRARILSRSNRICEQCKSAMATQVHHLTYERVGCEQEQDLLAVCVPCHLAIHENRNNK